MTTTDSQLQCTSQLQELNALKGGIHDLKNFLGSLLGNLALARRLGYQGGDAIQRLEAAEKAAQHAKKIADGLLNPSVCQIMAPIGVPLDQLIEEVAHITLSEDRIQFKIHAPNEVVELALGHEEWVRLLQNLFMNAQEALGQEGMIEVTARIQPHGPSGGAQPFLEFHFKDNGPGMSPEIVEQVFQNGFTTKVHGHGIGLSQVKQWVEAAGGAILCRSHVGQGTEFEIWMPLRGALSVIPICSSDAQQRVLLVDDDEMLGEVTESMLQSLGYTTERATSAAQAIRRYRMARETGVPFDSVILDLSLSGAAEGQAVLDTLKLYDPSVKAILSTGHTYSPQAQAYQDHGFKGYLAKPYSMEELVSALNETAS
jgi:two-component system cell cycle sensor histidine kinase/response regulator CckA